MSDPTTSLLASIQDLVRRNEVQKAEEQLAAWIRQGSVKDIHALEAPLRDVIDNFQKKRKRDLTALLDNKLGNAGAAPSADFDPTPLRNVLRDRLRWLSDSRIYQWSTDYRDFIHYSFTALQGAMISHERVPTLADVLIQEFSKHATEIFSKGWAHLSERDVTATVRIAKSLGGLARFLELPAQAYADL